MKRFLLAAGALCAVALVIYLAFLGDGPEPIGPLQDLQDSPVVPVEQDEPEATAGDVAAAREQLFDAPEPVANDGPPDTYTRALGGLIGRLVEPDGTPVPDMGIEALAATVHDFLPEIGALFEEQQAQIEVVKGVTRTDEEGRFRFEDLEPRGIYLLGIDQGGPRSTIRFVDHAPNPGEVVDLGDVRLDPYVIFTGRVVDEDGTGVAGARIRATNLPSIIFTFGVQDVRPGFTVAFQEDVNDDWRVAPIPAWATRLVERFPVPATRSEDDGTFRLEGVPIGMATVLVDKQDLLSLVHGPVPTGNAGERHIGDLRLKRGQVLTGRVADMLDDPVPNAEILAGPLLELAPAAVLAPVATTDAEGRFEARGLPDTEHVVAARPKGGVEWTIVTGVEPGYDDALIRIGSTHHITVIARNGAGEVLKRPSLAVQPVTGIPLHPLLVPSISLAGRVTYKEDGSVLIDELDPGKYSVLARAKGYTIGKSVADLTRGPARVELVLAEDQSAVVQVVEAGSGEPVHYAMVGIFDLGAGDEMKKVPLSNRRTGPEGRVEFDGLTNGQYRVSVLHPAYATAEEDFSVPPVQNEALTVELKGGGSLKGRVHAGNAPPDKQRFIAMGMRGADRFPRFTVTDENGEFEVTHLEAGEYSVTVMQRFADQSLADQISGYEQFMPERFLEAVITEGEQTYLDIDILGSGIDGPTARIRGRVTLNNAPGADLTVSARPRGEWRARKSARTDANGLFDFGEVPAGKVSVQLQQKGRSGSFMSGRLAELSLDLEPNEVREVVFDVRTGRLRGRVLLDRNGGPAAGAEVGLRAEGESGEFNSGTRMGLIADRDGRFFFESVPAGTYRLRAHRDGYTEAVIHDIVVPVGGEPPPQELYLSRGIEVAGLIELPQGREPPRFVWVNFQSEGKDRASSGARVDRESLKFKVDGLKPGRYTVQVYAGESYEPIVIDVPAGGLDGLVLRPQLIPEQPEKLELPGGR